MCLPACHINIDIKTKHIIKPAIYIMYDNDKYNNKKDDDTHGPFSGMLASLSAT